MKGPVIPLQHMINGLLYLKKSLQHSLKFNIELQDAFNQLLDNVVKIPEYLSIHEQ